MVEGGAMSKNKMSERALEQDHKADLLHEARAALNELQKATAALEREQRAALNLSKESKRISNQEAERKMFNIKRRSAHVTRRAIDCAVEFRRLRNREK